MSISLLQNASNTVVHHVNNQVNSGSNTGMISQGNNWMNTYNSYGNNIPGKRYDQDYLHPGLSYPTPQPSPSTTPSPSVRSISDGESNAPHPARPGPNPHQMDLTSPMLAIQSPPPTITQSETPIQDPVPPAEYKVGIIRALDAQAHLTDRTLETIGKLLKKTHRTITADRWIAQVGFMHDRKEFRDVFQHDGLYGPHNQIIIVTVFSPRSASQKRCDRLAEKMSVVLGGFYGLLVWKKTVAVMRPSRAHKVPKGATLFGEESSVSQDGVFHKPAVDPTQTAVSIAASNKRDGHANYLYTQVRYKEREEHEGLHGTRTVEVSDLTFKGPAEYDLRKASFQVIGDAPCDFQNVVPRERGSVDTDGQYKESSQDIKTHSKTGTIGIEAAQNGVRATGSASVTVGESHATSRDTMRNGISVVHNTDAEGTRITYTPAHPDHDRTQLTIHANDLPKVTVCPGNASSQLGIIRVRATSTWRVKQLAVKAPSIGSKMSAFSGLKYNPTQPKHRKDADIVFCVEVDVPRGTTGLNSVSRRMNESF